MWAGGGRVRWGPRGDWIEGNIPVVGVIAGRDPQKYNIHTNHNTSILQFHRNPGGGICR